MARYTGPKTKIARKFGEAIFGPDKTLSKKKLAKRYHKEKGIKDRDKEDLLINILKKSEV